MRGAALAAAGATFVGTVIVGFVAGLLGTQLTGASWWVLVGLFAGLLVGVAEVVVLLRRALR